MGLLSKQRSAILNFSFMSSPRKTSKTGRNFGFKSRGIDNFYKMIYMSEHGKDCEHILFLTIVQVFP